MPRNTLAPWSAAIAIAVATPCWSQDGAAPPPFKKTVPTEQLSAAFRESGADAMIARLASHGQAEGFGIHTACVIIRVGDTPLEPMGSLLRKNHPYAVPAELHGIDTTGNPHNSKIDDVKLGTDSFQYRNLVSWDLQHGQRNAKWDRMILTNLPEGLDRPGVFLHFVGIKSEVTGFTADVLE